MVAGVLLVSGVPLRVLVGSPSCARSRSARSRSGSSRTGASAFLAFLDPGARPEGAGFQSVQAMIGIGSGGITGNGLGEGVQKINYLPEAHTDMIFAIIGEELGLVGATARDRRVRRLRVGGFQDRARAAATRSASCSRPGSPTLVCGQAAVNLAAVLGIAPLTGIPLPFVSYGGSSLVVLLAAVGILLNIAVNERVVEARVPDRSRRNGRSRAARARSRGGAARPRSDGDVRRDAATASSRGWFLRRASSSTRSASRLPAQARRSRQLRALCAGRAGARSRACAILGRRRPDVVLGGGGLRRRADGARRPAAPHPGGADRGGRAPRARQPAGRAVRARVFLAYDDPDGRDGAKYRVVGRPIPAAHLGALA